MTFSFLQIAKLHWLFKYPVNLFTNLCWRHPQPKIFIRSIIFGYVWEQFDKTNWIRSALVGHMLSFAPRRIVSEKRKFFGVVRRRRGAAWSIWILNACRHRDARRLSPSRKWPDAAVTGVWSQPVASFRRHVVSSCAATFHCFNFPFPKICHF